MLASFLVLGSALVFFSIGYNNDEKETLYLNNARNIGNQLAKVSETLTNQNAASDDSAAAFLRMNLQMSAQNLDATIMLCNSEGRVSLVILPSGMILNTDQKLPKSIISALKSHQSIKEESTLDGFFDSNYTVAGVPVIADDGNTVNFGVFVCSKSGSMMKMMSGIFKIFIYCVIFILAAAFVVIYIVTHHLTKPLRQMSAAAKSFSKGDFSARIPVRSNDEIGQLSSAFNNMAASLLSLEEMRSSFVANVSHELKTPMTSISGFIDGILDGTIPPEKEKHYLEIVSEEVKRLSRLVKSLLDAARIQSGEYKVNPSEFDAMEMARRVIIGFEQQIDKKHLDIRGLDNEEKFVVYSDFDITYQIINNLVDNAVKFSQDGGYIEINVVSKDDKVFVSVKNSGMGIPAQDLPYVFDRFYKTDKSRSRDKKGVGLGLYIVKTILNYQGQDIWVKSVEGEYCEFVFTLKKAHK